MSILAALDLHNGHVIAQVHDRHRSGEFISLLKEIDAHYPAEATIRIILDNHSAHISKETMKYLADRPGRFLYVHTPTHGSWLNLVEESRQQNGKDIPEAHPRQFQTGTETQNPLRHRGDQ